MPMEWTKGYPILVFTNLKLIFQTTNLSNSFNCSFPLFVGEADVVILKMKSRSRHHMKIGKMIKKKGQTVKVIQYFVGISNKFEWLVITV
jgi:hypothetical protein